MESRGRILIVDDDTSSRTRLAALLRDHGYSVETAGDGFKALPKLDELAPDLLLTDLDMRGMTGVELMRKARELDGEMVCVVMTASGSVESAVAAMRQGASDYLTKPVDVDALLDVIERGLQRRRLRAEAGRLRSRLAQRPRLSHVIGTSPAIQSVIDTVLQVAPSRASVLITGESGTGKDLIAAALHEHSPRAEGPFIKLHGAALAENGDTLLQQAHGGTLFLDEIGEISLATQVKLLRFLQSHELQRPGNGHAAAPVDARIIAATHRDLLQRVKEGAFREDLFYRLNVVAIELPPLRARTSDIPLLASHFLARFAEQHGKEITGFSDEALERLVRYAWPGNVRELENVVERAVVVARQSVVAARDLGATVGSATASDAGAPAIPGSSMADIERYAILATLEHTGGSTSRAAEILGISPRTIQYRLHDYQRRAGKDRT